MREPAELSVLRDKEALSTQRMRDTHRRRGKERPRGTRELLLRAGRRAVITSTPTTPPPNTLHPLITLTHTD